MRLRYLVPTLYILFLMLPIYWLLNMSFKTTNEILGGFTLWPHSFTLDNYEVDLHRSVLVQRLYQLARPMWSSTPSCRSRWRCPRPMPSRAIASSATSICSSGS